MASNSKPLSRKGQVMGQESLQQNQQISELLRTMISRSDDIVQLRNLSDKKTGRLRYQTVMADKTIEEAEYREEARISREDALLDQLYNLQVDTPSQKKYYLCRMLEKVARKMIRINIQLEDEPTDRDLNLSEIHLNKIMNIKINSDNTYFSYNDDGRMFVSVPSANYQPQLFRENLSKQVRIIECCLNSDKINVHLVLTISIKQSRELFAIEVARQRSALDEGVGIVQPNITVFITNKKKKNGPVQPKKTPNGVNRRIVVSEE